MKFTSAFSISALVAVAAAAKSFGVITIHSGSQYHLSSISTSGSKVIVGDGDAVKFLLNDDNSLVDTNTNKYLTVDNQNIVEASSPDNNFGISSTGLTYNGKEQFAVDPKTSQLTISSAADNVGLRLRVSDEKDASDVHP